MIKGNAGRVFILAVFWMVTLAGTMLSSDAAAHDLPYAVVELSPPVEGARKVEVYTHIPALLTGIPPAHLSGPQADAFLGLDGKRLEQYERDTEDWLKRETYLTFDGQITDIGRIAFPSPAELKASAQLKPGDKQASAPFSFTIPDPGSRQFEIALPYRLGRTLLVIRNSEDAPARNIFLEAGERSGTISLTETPGVLATIGTFIHQGIIHIVPLGMDHILFVISLAIAVTALGRLLLYVSAFTIAHTLTLGLATFGVVTISPAIVEPLIALSITVMALDNIRGAQAVRQRLGVIILFGLLHGMGFAGALRELGLPQGQELISLLAFNVGVEIGQLIVIAGVFVLTGWWMTKPWFRQRIVIPVSLIIGAIGAFWTIERVVNVL